MPFYFLLTEGGIIMIKENETLCPICNGELHPYGHATRIVRSKYGKRRKIVINRFKCARCGALHNELPEFVKPYVRYERDILEGVLEGLITPETLGFEDYPSELTMHRWMSKFGRITHF